MQRPARRHAIEHSIESPTEQATTRAEAPAATPSTVLGDDTPLTYRLASFVPPNWVPLVPVQLPGAAGGIIQRLRRGAVLQADGSATVNQARGNVLSVGISPLLYDEEIPREGVRLTRSRRMVRWLDGGTWLWTAYRRPIARGESSSGLQFDQLHW